MPVQNFRSICDKGVTGEIADHKVALGNLSLLKELAIDSEKFADQTEALRLDGQTVMFITVGGITVRLIGVADTIRDTTPSAIEALRN